MARRHISSGRWKARGHARAAILLAGITLGCPASQVGSAEPHDATIQDGIEAFLTGLRKPRAVPSDPPGPFKSSPRLAFFGDSNALAIGIGLGYWLQKKGSAEIRLGGVGLGCGLMREGVYRVAGKLVEHPAHCTPRDRLWPDAIRSQRPDVAIVMAGTWDVADRRISGDSEWRHIGDPQLDAYLMEEMLAAIDILSADGALVIWFTHPRVRASPLGGDLEGEPPEWSPARMKRLNEMIFELERLRPGKVRVIDLAAWMRRLSGGDLDPRYRPDGVHFSKLGAVRISQEWLGEEVLRVYREPRSR